MINKIFHNTLFTLVLVLGMTFVPVMIEVGVALLRPMLLAMLGEVLASWIGFILLILTGSLAIGIVMTVISEWWNRVPPIETEKSTDDH